jgi:hypothetical protein
MEDIKMPSPNVATNVQGALSYKVFRTDTGALIGSGSLGTKTIDAFTRTTSSVRTPNFRNLQKWQLPINPYNKLEDLFDDHKWTFVAFSQEPGLPYKKRWEIITNVANSGGKLSHDLSTDADDPAQKVVAKLIEQMSLAKTNSGVAAAEMSKTASHVAHTATRLYNAYKALRSGRLGDFTKALGVTYDARQRKNFYTGMKTAVYKDFKAESPNSSELFRRFRYKKRFPTYESRPTSRTSDFLADTWLEYSYGWKPLLKDVYDHAQAAALVVSNLQGEYFTARANASCERTTIINSGAEDTTLQFHGYAKLSVVMEVNYKIPPGAVNLSTAFGLMNPLEVAWELVPFSFVADWFLPVGDAIRSLSAFNGLVFKSGFKTFKHWRTIDSKAFGNGKTINRSGVIWTGSTGSGVAHRKEFNIGRTNLTSFPSFGFPQLKDPRSFAHAASAIALLQSLFLRNR